MALYLKFNRPLTSYVRYVLFKQAAQCYCQHIDKVVDLEETNALDHFTSQLLQSKVSKWEAKKAKHQRVQVWDNCDREIETNPRAEYLDNNTATSQFKNYLTNGNHEEVVHLAKQCLERSICPDISVLMSVLSVCSQVGQLSLVIGFKELYYDLYPNELKLSSGFKHFIAEATWVKGDISKAVKLFEEVYRENSFLRRTVRQMLSNLIADLVSDRSEAALLIILKFSERLVDDFKDFYPLICVWQSCFLSEWYSDQCIALELLQKHNNLCNLIVNRISFVVFASLRCHRTEVVYRLLEILLKYDMKEQCSHVLIVLLDYQVRHGDFQNCSEIIRWAVDNDVKLPKNHQMKLINLLLHKKIKGSLAPVSPVKSSVQKHKWDLKF